MNPPDNLREALTPELAKKLIESGVVHMNIRNLGRVVMSELLDHAGIKTFPGELPDLGERTVLELKAMAMVRYKEIGRIQVEIRRRK